METVLITDEIGNRKWYSNGQLHRTDGPACEYVNGSCAWYNNGQLHRTTGPAVEFVNGRCEWYVNNWPYSFVTWCKITQQTPHTITALRLRYTV